MEFACTIYIAPQYTLYSWTICTQKARPALSHAMLRMPAFNTQAKCAGYIYYAGGARHAWSSRHILVPCGITTCNILTANVKAASHCQQAVGFPACGTILWPSLSERVHNARHCCSHARTCGAMTGRVDIGRCMLSYGSQSPPRCRVSRVCSTATNRTAKSTQSFHR